MLTVDIKRVYSLIEKIEQAKHSMLPPIIADDKSKKIQVSRNFFEKKQASLLTDVHVRAKSPTLNAASKFAENLKEFVPEKPVGDSKSPLPAPKPTVK